MYVYYLRYIIHIYGHFHTYIPFLIVECFRTSGIDHRRWRWSRTLVVPELCQTECSCCHMGHQSGRYEQNVRSQCISELVLVNVKFRSIRNVILIQLLTFLIGKFMCTHNRFKNLNNVVNPLFSSAIKTTMELLARNGYTCKGYIVDISDRDQVYERAAQTINEIGNVDILCNNAGVVCCRPFWDLPDRVIQNTYNINIISHYWTVKAFLPQMMQNNKGHIVTVGSVTGMLGTYGCSDYSATKFACVGFHESLLTDLKTHGYDGIHMTLICPYYINTGMFSGVRPRMVSMLDPEYVADRILEAIRKNEVWCVLPYTIRILTPLKWYVIQKKFLVCTFKFHVHYSLQSIAGESVLGTNVKSYPWTRIDDDVSRSWQSSRRLKNILKMYV